MTVVTSPDFVSFSDMELLRALTSCERRPNLLIDCVDGGAESVLAQLEDLCVGPFFVSQLPGALNLPQGASGTLILHDVAALTIAQQVALFDWLHQQQGAVQVVSLTKKRLMGMVCDGRFLEGLFYRLNTISVTARGAR
jgi:transcriptional regulator of aromatic amino acid metabolism